MVVVIFHIVISNNDSLKSLQEMNLPTLQRASHSPHLQNLLNHQDSLLLLLCFLVHLSPHLDLLDWWLSWEQWMSREKHEHDAMGTLTLEMLMPNSCCTTIFYKTWAFRHVVLAISKDAQELEFMPLAHMSWKSRKTNFFIDTWGLGRPQFGEPSSNLKTMCDDGFATLLTMPNSLCAPKALANLFFLSNSSVFAESLRSLSSWRLSHNVQTLLIPKSKPFECLSVHYSSNSQIISSSLFPLSMRAFTLR